MSSTPTIARGHMAVFPSRDVALTLLPSLVSSIDQLGHTVTQLDAQALDDPRTATELIQQTAPEILFVGDSRPSLADVTNAFPWLPVVLFGDATTLDREALTNALHAGVSDFVELPCDMQRLDDAIERQRRRKRRLRAHENEQIDLHLKELEKDHRAGRYIQLGMLPPSPMAIDPYRLRHRIQPSLMLSGDFVDYFRFTDRHFACYVADVSGHGASSAFVTVLLKNFSRRIRREFRPSMLEDPGEILQSLNTELLDQKIDKHIAIWLAVFDVQTHRATYVNAGHFPPAILVNRDGPQFLELSGRPVGLFPSVSYRHETVSLEVDDQLIVYSDGVLELLSDDSLAEKEARLIDASRKGFVSFDSMWAKLEVSDNPGPDDVSCLVVTREA